MATLGLIGGGEMKPDGELAYLYLFAIILATAIPFLIWTELYKYNKASIMGIYGLTTSIFGVIATGIMIPEANVFSWQILVAMVLITMGMWIANKTNNEKEKET